MTRLHALRVSETVQTEYVVGAKDDADAIRKFLDYDKRVIGPATTRSIKHGPRSSARIESVEPETFEREKMDG